MNHILSCPHSNPTTQGLTLFSETLTEQTSNTCYGTNINLTIQKIMYNIIIPRIYV